MMGAIIPEQLGDFVGIRNLGAGFSPGSAYIESCRTGGASTGNLSTWRWVGTNHHMTKVVNDLANLHGS
jgi:Beta protein